MFGFRDLVMKGNMRFVEQKESMNVLSFETVVGLGERRTIVIDDLWRGYPNGVSINFTSFALFGVLGGIAMSPTEIISLSWSLSTVWIFMICRKLIAMIHFCNCRYQCFK